MKDLIYLVFSRSGLIFTILTIFFFACSNEQKKHEELLVNQARSIKLNCDSSNSSSIENVIISIKKSLSEYPDSERYLELNSSIEELNRCLDFHRVREYTEKFEDLNSTSFYDVYSAIQELDYFLDLFQSDYASQLILRHPKLQVYINEAEEIKQEFETMKSFFERDFFDLLSYNSGVQYQAYKYDNSRYETVRKSWNEIQLSTRKEQATRDLDKKVAKFEEYLISDAKNLCLYNYKYYSIDESRSIQTIDLGSPIQHDVYNAKVCEGVFRVYLRGSFVGIHQGSVKISVKGMITVTVDDNQKPNNVEYRNIDFSILDETGDL